MDVREAMKDFIKEISTKTNIRLKEIFSYPTSAVLRDELSVW